MGLIAKSIIIGLIVTLSLLLALGFGVEYLSGDARDAIVTVPVYLLYWPVLLMKTLGVGPDCANADDLNVKLGCGYFAIGCSAITYSLLSYTILRWRKRKVVLR